MWACLIVIGNVPVFIISTAETFDGTVDRQWNVNKSINIWRKYGTTVR